jgi:SNF2-related domain/SNF2 Helicase protein/Helicase conserved C-terminal domain
VVVVHGLVTAGGRLACWAETAPAGPVPRRRSLRRPEPHPFAVAPAVAGHPATVVLVLPAVGSSPVASPELGVRRPTRGAVRLLPWSVPVVLLPAGSDLEGLVAELADAAAGGSVGYLSDLVGFAADLVGRCRVLPAVVDAAAGEAVAGDAAAGEAVADGAAGGAGAGGAAGGCEARWRAVLAGRDELRFEALHRAMPGVARAAVPGADAAGLTRAALDREADALVRARLPGPLLDQSGGAAVRAGLPGAVPDQPGGAAVRAGLPGAVPDQPGGAAVRAWLAALTGADPSLAGDAAPLRMLRHRVDRWAESGRPAPVRTCLRLRYEEELPGAEEGGWLLEFLLQPVDEPSLLVPAAEVWRDPASPLLRWVDYPQEALLAGLGRASRLYPDLEHALRTPHPTEVRLDTAGAHRFLTHAEVLVEAGFGVLLPAAWQRRQELGLTLTLRGGQPAAPVLRDVTANRNAIVGYRWGLAIGDELLSEADLIALARAKVPLVRLRGRWVHLDQQRLRAGLAFLARGGSGEITAGEAIRLTRLFPETAVPLPVTSVDGSGWLADLLTGRAGQSLELVDPPATLRARLRPYQRRGLSWLVFLDRLGVGALLADDMGLGKTVQVLALEALRRAPARRPPTLIVCPLSVLGNWRREIERFTPSLAVHVHHGAARTLDRSAPLVLTTYQVAARDADLLGEVQWDRIVLDEAQHVKNATGVTARALRRIPARHRVALTGTPVENRLTELWSIADFLNPGILGPASLFRARYSVPVERYGDADAAARLRRATRLFLLRRVKTDRSVIADLPERFERRQWCTLTAEQASLYQAVVDEMLARMGEGREGTRRRALVLSALTKLKQVCNHPAHLLGDGTSLAGRSGKLARLEEILAAALAAGDRSLVFTQFARFGAMLAPYLTGRLGTEVAFLHGGTPRGARDAMVARFQEPGAGPGVFLLSLRAGGTGLNLTAANHVVHVDRWWNPATEAQATDRAFRIGQRRDVQVHLLQCVGTIEDRIDRVMAEKRSLAGVAVGSGEGWLASLSAGDLAELVALSPEAAGD